MRLSGQEDIQRYAKFAIQHVCVESSLLLLLVLLCCHPKTVLVLLCYCLCSSTSSLPPPLSWALSSPPSLFNWRLCTHIFLLLVTIGFPSFAQGRPQNSPSFLCDVFRLQYKGIEAALTNTPPIVQKAVDSGMEMMQTPWLGCQFNSKTRSLYMTPPMILRCPMLIISSVGA